MTHSCQLSHQLNSSPNMSTGVGFRGLSSTICLRITSVNVGVHAGAAVTTTGTVKPPSHLMATTACKPPVLTLMHLSHQLSASAVSRASTIRGLITLTLLRQEPGSSCIMSVTKVGLQQLLNRYGCTSASALMHVHDPGGIDTAHAASTCDLSVVELTTWVVS